MDHHLAWLRILVAFFVAPLNVSQPPLNVSQSAEQLCLSRANRSVQKFYIFPILIGQLEDL